MCKKKKLVEKFMSNSSDECAKMYASIRNVCIVQTYTNAYKNAA